MPSSMGVGTRAGGGSGCEQRCRLADGKQNPVKELRTSGVIGTGTREADDPRAADTRTTAEIIAAYIKIQGNDDATESLATIHYRGGLEEFRAGMELLASSDPRKRAAGADVLAQLGWHPR